MHINAVSAYIIWRAVCVSSRYSYIHNRLIMCLHAVTWKENPNTFFTSVRGVALSGDKTLGMRLHFNFNLCRPQAGSNLHPAYPLLNICIFYLSTCLKFQLALKLSLLKVSIQSLCKCFYRYSCNGFFLLNSKTSFACDFNNHLMVVIMSTIALMQIVNVVLKLYV